MLFYWHFISYIDLFCIFPFRCSKIQLGTIRSCSIVTFEHAPMAESLKAKRSRAKSQFTRCEKRLSDALADAESTPVATIERRYSELREKWNAVQEAHDAFEEAVEAEAIEVGDADKEQWIDEIMQRFDSIEVKADAAIEERKRSFCGAVPTEAAFGKVGEMPSAGERLHSKSSVQLERIKLEMFDGDIRKYPKFREQFESYVKPLCTPSQLPFVLRSHLAEAVREEVDNIDDNLDTLWTRLDKKYGNLGKQVDAILDDISKAPKGDGKSALKMIHIVEKAYRDLTRMGRSSEMHNGTVLSMIEKKLPEEMRFEWIQAIAEKEDADSDLKFAMMLKLLGKWRVMIEYDHAAIRRVSEKKVLANHAVKSTEQVKDGRKEKESCWIHTAERHPIWVCQVFKGMQPSERIQMAKDNNACLACLEVKCPGAGGASNCKKRFKCTVDGCKEAHNKLLHL